MENKETPKRTLTSKMPLLGIYLMLMSFILVYLLVELWPEIDKKTQEWVDSVTILWCSLKIDSDTRLILLVILTGALGSCVHAATSFATFVGNRSLVPSWAWWYILRPFIGSALALIFYFVIRGGLLSTGTGADDLSPFGIAAVAGLVGMFSKQATDKLRELFDNLFKTEKGKGDDVRGDKLGELLPVSKVMIKFDDIKAYRMAKKQDEKQIKIKDLYSLLEDKITRIPIFDDENAAKYVIHQSLLYKFIALKNIEAASSKVKFDFNQATLYDFLQYKDMRAMVDALAFVSVQSLLADAKQAMEKIKGCQDVFVTENGKQTEPVKGWLTNIEIAKNLTA